MCLEVSALKKGGKKMKKQQGGKRNFPAGRLLAALLSLCLGAAAVGYRTESMHGAGSPQAQRIMIARQGNIQGKKQLAKEIAGIK